MDDQNARYDRPVLYLDLDDTVLTWRDGSPRAGAGSREFILWALARFEIRWLTSWAPSGCMDPGLLRELAGMIDVPVAALARIRGLDWEGGSKVDGIAWLEHAVLERPFLWLEDATLPDAALDFLAGSGYLHCFRRCDVTRDPEALRSLHRELAAAHP